MRKLLFGVGIGLLVWAVVVVPIPLAVAVPVPATPLGEVAELEGAAVEQLDVGAEVFLVPPAGAEAARSAAEGRLEVIEVDTLDAAIDALTDG